MNNKKSINIYMGIIGEAYVDKETAWTVLLAAKKNILDVEAIIAAASNLNTPLTKAKNKAQLAINAAVEVYEKLKNAINNFSVDSYQYSKLFNLLYDLNLNDFDENPSNGGNIYTARENFNKLDTLKAEIISILHDAQDLLDANKLNAVVRCKEYNIAKEMFEAMIPEKIISPEDLSDAMESELIRRINAVKNEIDYANLVSEEIENISTTVSKKIDRINSGEDSEFAKPTSDILYWYAGNIDPTDSEFLEDAFGLVWNQEYNTYICQARDEEGNAYNVDFGIDGPLKANKWFHHPLHLVQDGQLIAGVDGGKAKYENWYVAVPRYILTIEGTALFRQELAGDPTLDKTEWTKAHANEDGTDNDLVKRLYPCKPQDVDHIDAPHLHLNSSNIWIDENENTKRDDGSENNYLFGYKKITEDWGGLSINGVDYDIWTVPVNQYTRQRLNVYFNLGEPNTTSTAKGLYWYIGTEKPTFNSNIIDENGNLNEGWTEITELPTKESPLTSDKVFNTKIFYLAIPESCNIYDDADNILTDINDEATSPYTLMYNTLIGKNSYNVYITGNDEGKFNDKIYSTEDIIIEPTGETEPEEPTGDTEPVEPTGETEPINPTEPEEPTGETEPINPTEPEEPTGDTEPVEPTGDNYYWYVGWNNPNDMSDISPIVDDMESPGWRLIGTSLPEYNSGNKLWDGTNVITMGESGLNTYYVAIPNDCNACPRDGLGNDGTVVSMFTLIDNVTINNVTYKVYESVGKSRKFNIDVY